MLQASENTHRLLDHSHVTLIDEPLGKFVPTQAIHDLNLFSRLSGTTGIARAYRVRLTDEADLFDVAFQVSDGLCCSRRFEVPKPAWKRSARCWRADRRTVRQQRKALLDAGAAHAARSPAMIG